MRVAQSLMSALGIIMVTVWIIESVQKGLRRLCINKAQFMPVPSDVLTL